MPSHIMLSYQWDDQDLVRKVYNRLREDGLPVWMDIEGGVTGNINDAMAAGVEEAVVICPFLTPAYQASRSCKKELSYADTREVIIVPVMLTNNWEASEWLGLITAGLLWLDFRNLDSEEHFEMCLKSLEEEIMFNACHLLAVEDKPCDEPDRPEPPIYSLKKKPGRGFRHAVSKLYIHESADEQISQHDSGSRNTVALQEEPSVDCSWQEIKGDGCKYYKNVITDRYLGFDPLENRVYSVVRRSVAEEWLLLMDQTDQSHQRAVIVKHKHSGLFLAIRDGTFIGLTSYNKDCKWFLE